MPKRVSKETTEGEYASEISNIGNFHAALGTVEGIYKSEASNSASKIATAMSTISGSWAGDDVEVKLESLVNDCVKSGLTAIENDVSGGSFLSMKNTVNLLKTDLTNCKDAKKKWEDAKKTYEKAYTAWKNEPDRVEGEYHGNYAPSVHNTRKDELQRAMNSAKTDMDNAERILEQKVTSCNTHFSELSQFVFGGASTANNAVGGGSTLGSQTGGPKKEDDFTAVDSVTVAGEDVSEVAAMAAGLATPVTETVESDVQVGDTYTDTEGNVYDNKGGEDGHHYASREDAIDVLLARAPDVYPTREAAEKVVDEYIEKGLIVLPPVDGMKDYTEARHTEQTFETTTGQTAERVEDLTITGEALPGEGGDETLIPEHGEGEAHYVTSTGETFTGEIEIDYTHQGAAFQKDETITADATGEEVAQVGTHQVMEYNDNWTGADVNVTDKKIQQGDTVMETRDMVYEYGEGETYTVSSQWSYVQPAEGQPIAEGTYVSDDYGTTHTYTYSYDNQGQLIETDSYYSEGGLFGWGKGDHVDTRVVDTSMVYTLKVTTPDGTTTTTPILMDSQMGFAEVARQYENARIDVGYRADYAREGIHHLTWGDGDPVEVTGVMGDGSYSYTFELIPPSN